MITLYKNFKGLHLLNPCLLEFHNVRVLDSSNKSHLQLPTNSNSQIPSTNKSRFHVYEANLQARITKKHTHAGVRAQTQINSLLDEQIFCIVQSALQALFFSTHICNPVKQSFSHHQTYKPTHQRISYEQTNITPSMKFKKWWLLLLFLSLVVNKNSSSKCSSTDLLHDLILIHPRLHCSRSTNTQFLNPQNKTKQTKTRKPITSNQSSSHHFPLPTSQNETIVLFLFHTMLQ